MDKVFRLSNGKEAVLLEDAEKREASKNSNFRKVLNRLTSAITSRASLFSQLGKSYDGDRDLYTILGYPTTISYTRYEARYSRQELAKACVDRPVNSSWRKKPEITDNSDAEKETAFEKEIISLEKRLHIYNYMIRADKLAGIGNYSVILFGFGDESKLDQPVVPSENLKLNYISVFSEANAKIKEWEKDTSNERFGLPKIYELTVYQQDGNSSQNYRVHYSRVLHIVQEPLESDIYGTPQLKSVYNRLADIEKISGGSGEMYWKGARPGYALEVDEEYDFDEDAKTDLDAELDEWDHELRRFLRLQGVKVTPLQTQISSPKEFLDILIDLVAAGRNIPKRILMGSERGELASGQDAVNWNERMESRREDYIEPIILRPFIDKLIFAKVLPVPEEDGYEVKWPEFEVPGEEAIVRNAEFAAKALAAYNNSPGLDLIMPPAEFLQRFFGYTKEETDTLLDGWEDKLEDDMDDLDIEDDMDEEENNSD